MDEPSLEDFEMAEEEEAQVGPRAGLFRILRLVGVLIVVFALLLYFIVPFNNVFTNIPYHWLHPGAGPHTIPLAPEHPSNPKIPA